MQILLVFGGRSVEHEVSIRSAACIYQGLCANNNNVVMCAGIDRSGQWYTQDGHKFFSRINGHHVPEISFRTGEKVWLCRKNNQVILVRENNNIVFTPDIVFPITHGTYGEDGSLQGLFQQLSIPFVGCDVCASACAMDKDITKRLLRDAGIAVAPWQTIHAREKHEVVYAQLAQKFGSKLFVKPARIGSSIGATLVSNEGEFKKAVDFAFRFDNKILVEQCIVGREIEFAVLGNEDVCVSPPGEISSDTDFYTYEDKYISDKATLKVATRMEPPVQMEGQQLAHRAYQALGCEGLARVDFFLVNDKEWMVNEINTLPGFTSISMYPKLWEVGGKSLDVLLEELIILSLERYKCQSGYILTRNN